MKWFFVAASFVFVGWVSTAQAQPAASFEKPVKLRVTGEVLQLIEPPPEDIVTAKILIQDTSLLLRVGKVEELTRIERQQAVKWGILFREVRFYGPDPLLEKIVNAKGTGKHLTIEGQLDTKARQFLVSAVDEGASAR